VPHLLDQILGGPTPPIDGTLNPEYLAVAASLVRQLRRHQGGAAVCVYHRGRCVVDLWGGARNRAGDAWRSDTMAPSFSTTKGVASTLVHIMVDRGLLDYDARVATYWPEFARAGKADITLRHVLSHQSGLYHIRQMIDHADRMLDWEHMIRAIENTRPMHRPGARTGYHGLTYGYLVGEILQRVTGERFSDLVQSELVEPLELDGMYVGAPEEVHDRAAELIWPGSNTDRSPHPERQANVAKLADLAHEGARVLRNGLRLVGVDLDLGSIFDALAPRGISTFDFGSSETLSAAIPAANGLFTARSLARMYAALAGGGKLGDVRLLSERAVRNATARQNEAPGRSVLPIDMRWRLGYHGVPTTAGFLHNGFGHFGFGGSGGFADPKRDLAVALIVNCGMGTPFGDLRVARMSGAAVTCAREVDRRAAARMLRPESDVSDVASFAAATRNR
jgi:CubicO group peptidase (beta-lactamase class C family)